MRHVEHCAHSPHATSNKKPTTHNRRTRPGSEFKKSSNEFARGSEQGKSRPRCGRTGIGALAVVVAHDPCTPATPPGSMHEKKTREGGHLLSFMVVTEDTSQLPMSWLNALAFLNTAQVPHAPQATQNMQHNRRTRPGQSPKVFERVQRGSGKAGRWAAVVAHDPCTCNPSGDRSMQGEKSTC
jgi:hypothetical protein